MVDKITKVRYVGGIQEAHLFYEMEVVVEQNVSSEPSLCNFSGPCVWMLRTLLPGQMKYQDFWYPGGSIDRVSLSLGGKPGEYLVDAAAGTGGSLSVWIGVVLRYLSGSSVAA